MTWEPKNKTDDDDDAVLTDSEDNKEKDELASDNRSDRVGEEARRGLDDTGKPFFLSTHDIRRPTANQNSLFSKTLPPDTRPSRFHVAICKNDLENCSWSRGVLTLTREILVCATNRTANYEMK